MEIISLCNYRATCPYGSDFMANNNFPEAYHAQGITISPFMGVSGRSRGRGQIQHIEENIADRAAHVVFLCR